MAGLDWYSDDNSPAIGEPVTVAQAKARQRVDHDDDDVIIGDIISEARSAIEAFLKQSLLYTTWRYRIDGGFPREIRLPIGPLRTSDGLTVQYVDDAGDTQTLASSDYQISLGMTGVIRPAFGKSWPSTRSIMDAVTVTFKAGEAQASDLRKAILSALHLEVGNRYENRESVVVGASVSEITSLSARNLLTPFVRHD